MDSFTAMPPASAAGHLPAQRIDAAGRTHVDQRAVLALALPLMANSAVQIVLNLTDMWFMGRISTRALAAVGAVQWLVIAVMLVLGGAGTAVQTLVAQHFGARRYRRAGQAVWTALWAMACTAPLFVLVGAARHLILAPFGFDSRVEQLASAFWFPRVGGAFLAAAVWAMFGFFNGIGRPRVTLAISIVATVTNALLNPLFIFRLRWGIASACTTLVAESIGARARDSALQVGARVILLAALYMGAIGVLIALGGRWVLPFFIGSHDSESAQAVVIGTQLLWLAAGYQFFDGLNLGSSMCLRGAGDVRIPAALVLTVSLLLFVPLAHAFTFASGQGWVRFLPQFGWGAVGGWVAVLIYVMVLGSTLFLRWRSGAWQKIRL